jgi:hypothetical protein
LILTFKASYANNSPIKVKDIRNLGISVSIDDFEFDRRDKKVQEHQ